MRQKNALLYAAFVVGNNMHNTVIVSDLCTLVVTKEIWPNVYRPGLARYISPIYIIDIYISDIYPIFSFENIGYFRYFRYFRKYHDIFQPCYRLYRIHVLENRICRVVWVRHWSVVQWTRWVMGRRKWPTVTGHGPSLTNEWPPLSALIVVGEIPTTDMYPHWFRATCTDFLTRLNACRSTNVSMYRGTAAAAGRCGWDARDARDGTG